MRIYNDRLIIINQINEDYSQGDFNKAIQKYKDFFTFPVEEGDILLFEKLMKSAFILEEYKLIIEMMNKISEKGYESYKVIYYTLLSYIALENLYLGNLFIKNSKLLSDAKHKLLYASDGANYSNILMLENKNNIYALIIVNFVLGLCRKQVKGTLDINKEYILFTFMDLLNVLVELNYPVDVVKKLYNDFERIYKI